jgi:adenine-specific DNA-methyltransferase
MVPAGVYVLTKRFSAKEERRRLVAAVFDPDTVPCEVVGFENHLNYFHDRGAPLDRTLAWGLSAFLNSSPLDTYFRQFNGHTQVNATDLRSLRYPKRDTLIALGRKIQGILPAQDDLDALVSEVLKVH